MTVAANLRIAAGHDYEQQFDEQDVEEIKKGPGPWSSGWARPRRHGHHHASDPNKREDRRVYVFVAVTEGSPLDEESRRIRGDDG